MRVAASRRACPLTCVVLLACTAAAVRAQEGDLRHPSSLAFDAMTTQTGWYDFSIGYRTFDNSTFSPGADDLFLTARLAWALRPRLELGVEASHVSRDFDDASLGSPSGASDTLVWTKYRFAGPGTAVFSIGAFASIPTGDEEDFLGSGNLDGGVFAAGGARTAGNGFLQAHVGVRRNADPEVGPPARGKNSILAGFGGSFHAKAGAEVFASFLLETARAEEGDTRSELSGGIRWALSRGWRAQVLGTVGFSDPAPDLSLAAGVVYVSRGR